MKKANPTFLALSETRLIPEIEDSEINMPGYSVVRCDAENRNTGGVIVYVRSDIKYEVVLIKKIISNCWCIAIQVRDNMYKGVIVVIYHSPSASDGEFIRFLEDIVELFTVKEECIVVGDFNIDLMKDSYYANKLRSTMSGLGLKQFVEEPTRNTKHSQTIIDLVFANKELIVKVLDKPKITDHAWLQVELELIESKSIFRVFKGRDYSKFNVNEFLTLLETKLVQRKGLNVNGRAEKLINSIVGTLNIAAPKKLFKIPNVWYGKKWFTDEIRVATEARDEAYCRAVDTKAEQDWVDYKNERNAVVKLIREKKKEYNENMIDQNKSDPVKMWKTLKEVIKGEPMERNIIENIDFEILDNINKCNIADKFNLFYMQSIENIVSSVERDRTKTDKRTIYVIEMRNTFEDFEIIEAKYLERIVMNLSNKKGTEEGISSELLKAIFHVIKDEFVGVINDSLRNGQCPNSWKTSTIIPIPKVGKPRTASEFRPINVLPIYEKVLELVVKEQLELYLESNDIITEHQSGFRKQHSCETAIQTIIDDWKLIISEGEMVGVIFMDLKRAFETVNRGKLVEKLYQYGIRGTVLEWFQSYLDNRMQQVRVGDIVSGLMATKYGVPQGSVLGPLLFIIYINDIVKSCPKGCNIKLFADDTIVYVTGVSCEEIEQKMNRWFNVIEEWMNTNGLKLNASKTKYMVVRSVRRELRANITVKCMDGTPIEQVDKIKYLGVIIDSKLRLEEHCDYMLKKIGKKTSFLNRLGNSLSVYSRCIVYKAIIAPHFEYCATLLIGMGETQLNKLQVAQNRAMRVILQCRRETKVEYMLQALQFMSVRQRLRYNTCIFVFKMVIGLLPDYLKNKIQIVGNMSGKQTRQAGNIVIQLRRTSNAQKSMFYEGIKMYNNLQMEIKRSERLEHFKRKLKEHILGIS